MKKFIRFWCPVFLWMIVIFLFSSRQKVAITNSYALSFLFFKTLHLIEYIFLYIVLYRALVNTGVKKITALWSSFAITTLYAITDEIHQRFVPTREGKLRDVIIDIIGGGLGWILLTQLLPKAPRKLKWLAKSWQLL
jgi:VanZ family protein